ncbi:MAG: hypothetical protein FJX35_01395 [Alphaproteobacteria bacterium]|nr:hypothetical protein [Alphaproteobacteria bacterium]
MTQYALRLPDSLMANARKVAARDNTSLNQLFVTAIAEKLSALQTEEMLRGRGARADIKAYRRVLGRVRDRPIENSGDKPE